MLDTIEMGEEENIQTGGWVKRMDKGRTYRWVGRVGWEEGLRG